MRNRAIWAVVCLMICELTACRQPAPKHVFPSASEALLGGFRGDKPPSVHAYDDLFLYFVQGFETFRTPTGSMTAFPGLPSRHGPIPDGMEGFARMAPMWGAWISSGRPAVVTLPGGNAVDLNETFRRGILSGTDPASPGYWGKIPYFDNQRIVEASDVALSLWLFRNTVWKQFTPSEKAQVAGWLYQVNGKHVPDNNWHVFVTFVNVVLNRLGSPWDRAQALQNYERLKEFYRGDGWFSDGPDGTFDYYNAWGIHYQLYWLQQVDPEWDSDFITTARRQFIASYRYLVSTTGVPILGRSVCYRMAAAAPLVFGIGTAGGDMTPGAGRRALDVTWQYFIQHGALQGGNVTQGYCGADPRILDDYSGSASCLWALRSLIVAYYKPPDSRFWQGPPGQLPVEMGDFSFSIKPTGWRVIGNKASGTVEIDVPNGVRGIPVRPYGWWRKLATAVLWRPFRPGNTAAKYHSARYISNAPFCDCLK